MQINSFRFLAFFSVILILYYILYGKTKAQNWLLLFASYYFYGIANWRMCILLFVATCLFYMIGWKIDKYNKTNSKLASLYTTFGVILGVGVLLYFKYLNFFIDSFIILFNSIGIQCNTISLNIILPIGISFFTFKLMGYVLDVHHKKINACTNFVTFATFISFFPTIMSGPIDRASTFIPQLIQKRNFKANSIINNLMLITWGLILKMCIADRLNIYNEAVFNNIAHHNGCSITLVSLFYPIQLYADFAGYSNMAIGVGGLLGFNVTKNFNYPFFGRNIAEYWRNWHMSLTSWLTDYVFMPLNIKFRNLGRYGSELSILITFILIGLWHGAAWTFALFGLYHGILYMPLMFSGSFFKKKRIKLNAINLPTIKDLLSMFITFILVALGLIIFRSNSFYEIREIVFGIFKPWEKPFIDPSLYLSIIGLIILLLHDIHHGFKSLKILDKIPDYIKMLCYLFYFVLFSVEGAGQFIYFQF